LTPSAGSFWQLFSGGSDPLREGPLVQKHIPVHLAIVNRDPLSHRTLSVARRREVGSLSDRVQRHIRELRKERGLTQEQVCELAGVSVDAVTRIESGTRTPTLPTL